MWQWIVANLGSITAFFAAFGAMIAAIGAVAAALIALKQVRVSQKQVQLMIEANYDSHRPLLIIIPGMRTMSTDYIWDAPSHFIELQNVGAGVATNIVGVIFPSTSSKDTRYYTAKFIDPLMQGGKNDRVGFTCSEDTVRLRGEQIVKEQYTLFAPNDAIVRVTVTYHDIFGHRHASICDFFDQWTSRSVVFLSNIPKDLEELRLDRNM